MALSVGGDIAGCYLSYKCFGELGEGAFSWKKMAVRLTPFFIGIFSDLGILFGCATVGWLISWNVISLPNALAYASPSLIANLITIPSIINTVLLALYGCEALCALGFSLGTMYANNPGRIHFFITPSDVCLHIFKS